jgi:hypothetical protein
MNRRDALLGSAAALATVGSTVAGANPAAAAGLTRLQEFVKLRGALDERLVTGFVVGRFDGVVLSAVFSRYRRTASGYVVVSYEQAYYTDLESGRVVERMHNPYTGDSVDVPVYNRPPTTLWLDTELRFNSPAPPSANVQVQQFARGPERVAGDLVFVEEVAVTVAATAIEPEFRYRDHTVLRAKRSELERRDTLTTPCQTTFDATCSWRPWLRMGTRPGYLSALGYGSFGAGMESLAPAWVEATKRVYPELLEHPERALEPAWSAAAN